MDNDTVLYVEWSMQSVNVLMVHGPRKRDHHRVARHSFCFHISTQRQNHRISRYCTSAYQKKSHMKKHHPHQQLFILVLVSTSSLMMNMSMSRWCTHSFRASSTNINFGSGYTVNKKTTAAAAGAAAVRHHHHHHQTRFLSKWQHPPMSASSVSALEATTTTRTVSSCRRILSMPTWALARSSNSEETGSTDTTSSSSSSSTTSSISHDSSCPSSSSSSCSSTVVLYVPTADDMQDVGGVLATLILENNNDDSTTVSAAASAKPTLILIKGDLGTGKTCLTRGFIRTMTGNVDLRVTSPTFLLSNTYPTNIISLLQHHTENNNNDDENMNPQQQEMIEIRHLDLYRLSGTSPRDFESLDLHHVFTKCIALMEWPERLGNHVTLPKERLEICIIIPDTKKESSNKGIDDTISTSNDNQEEENLMDDDTKLRQVILNPIGDVWKNRLQRMIQEGYVDDLLDVHDDDEEDEE